MTEADFLIGTYAKLEAGLHEAQLVEEAHPS